MAFGTVECATRKKLAVEKRNAAFDLAAFVMQRSAKVGRILEAKSATGSGSHHNSLPHQLRVHFFLWPVGVVANQVSAESCLQQRIQTLDVVPVARHLNHTHQQAAGREDQVFTDAMEFPPDGVAVACFSQTAKPGRITRPDHAADFDGV